MHMVNMFQIITDLPVTASGGASEPLEGGDTDVVYLAHLWRKYLKENLIHKKTF